MNGDVDRDHVRLDAEDAADGGIAIVGESADGVAGINDLERVERGGKGIDHLRRGHRQGDGSGLENGMTTGEKLLGVDVRDRAGG